MNTNESVIPLTGGSNSTGIYNPTSTYYPYDWYPVYPPTVVYPVYPNTYVTYGYPTYCSGEIHVFGCEHADTCKCGKAHRVVAPKKCGVCGK